MPPGTPVNAISQLRSLLFALKQGKGEAEQDLDHQEFTAVGKPNCPIDWAKAVKWVDGKKWIMKMDGTQRQYCRMHTICFRCRRRTCPVGECKNPPVFTKRANAIEDTSDASS